MSTSTNSTLVNATPFEVTLTDGTKETVELKQLTIRKLYQFTEHLRGDNMPSLVCLSVGKEEQWIDTLEIESYNALVRRCLEQNFPKAASIATADPIVAAKLAPMIVRLQGAEQMIAASGVNMNGSSPAPVASGSAAENGNASST